MGVIARNLDQDAICPVYQIDPSRVLLLGVGVFQIPAVEQVQELSKEALRMDIERLKIDAAVHSDLSDKPAELASDVLTVSFTIHRAASSLWRLHLTFILPRFDRKRKQKAGPRLRSRRGYATIMRKSP